MRNVQTLHSSWEFKLLKENIPGLIPKNIRKELNTWIPAIVPGTIHSDLFRAGLIPDPFYSDNETSIQWVAEMDWVYRTTFSVLQSFEKDTEVYLELKGLDTVSGITLNNKLLGYSSSMFVEYSFEVGNLLKKNNTLEIRFSSPFKYGRAQESKYGKLPVALASERVYIRKAQYSFGWDWGPSFPVSGIWRSISLVQYPQYYIKNFLFSTLSADEEEAEVEVKLILNHSLKTGFKIRADIGSERFFFNTSKKEAAVRFKIKKPSLWWPNGSGKPNLYKLTVLLLNNRMEIIDQVEREVGIRTVKLLLIENKKPAFRFVVNGIPIFAKGANWIPADSFIPDISEYKYQKLLNFVRISNMNMIRIWGGGFYENDILYNLCDRMGILVWHDFMFACAAYPEHRKFITDVEEEVNQNVLRLQYHPSIAIWCGNNENEWIWYQQQDSSYKEIPGYKIWHKIIPGILEHLDPQRPYWPSSPFNDELNTKSSDPNYSQSGNRHQWDLWSRWIDYNEVKKDNSLFVTEFGFQAPANLYTWSKALPSDSLKPHSKIFEFHNKQVEGPERVIKFLSSHLPVSGEWEDYIYLTQLNQAFALKVSLEHWLSRYPETSGSIIWQLNDCWPVTSWSLIDNELVPKISWYFVKRVFSPNNIIIPSDKNFVKVLNHSTEQFHGSVRIDYISSESGAVLNSETVAVNYQPFSSADIKLKSASKNRLLTDTIVVATLYNDHGQRINRTYHTDVEWKSLRLRKCNLNTVFETEGENSVLTISTDTPAFFVDVYHHSFVMSDRGFILLPGENFTVLTLSKNTTDFKMEDLKTFSLNNYLSQ